MKILRQQQIELKDFDQEDIHKFYLYAGKDLYDKYETRSTSNKLNTIKRGSFKVSDLPKEVEINFPANNRTYKSGSLISVWDHNTGLDRMLDIPLHINDGIITFPEGNIYRSLASILPKYYKKECGWEYIFVKIGNYPPKPIITVPLKKEGWVSLYKAFLEFLVFLRLFYGSEFRIFLDPEKKPAAYQKQFSSLVATLVPSVLNLGLSGLSTIIASSLSMRITSSHRGSFNEVVYKKITDYAKKNYSDLIIVNLGTGSFYTNPKRWTKEQLNQIKKHGNPDRKRTILDWILWAHKNNKHIICYSELDNPVALAHEIGHYLIEKEGGSNTWLQTNKQKSVFTPDFVKFVAFCCGIAGNIGELIGIVSNLLLSSPTLYIEFLASYKGVRLLKECGVSEKDIEQAKETFKAAWGTYMCSTVRKGRFATYGKMLGGILGTVKIDK